MIIKDKNYSVWYQYENMFGVACSDRLQFDTEEDADKFIQHLLEDDFKRVWKIVKNVWTAYYPDTKE